MTRLAFDIYGPTYPVSTTRLTRVTEYGPGTTFRPRRPMGSGLIVVAKGQDFVTATNFAIGNYVIVRDLDISEVSDSLNVLGGFYLEEGDFSLVTDRTKWLKFGGRSTISVLQRAIMGNESLSPFEGPSSIVDGYWRWGSDTYGGIMRRALFEANLQDPPGLPQIDTAWIGSDNIFWNDDDDSNDDPWPSFVGEFRTQCGTSLLDLYGELYGYGVELEIDARTFDVYAYNTDGYGTDRTGAFGAGNVRFETGVNIVSKIGGVALTRSIHGTVRATHLLVRTTDHPEGAFIESDDYTPGDPVYKRVYQSGDISGDPASSAALEARAQRNMDLRALAEDAVRFLMRPGDDESEGLYVAGPNYTPGPTAIDAHVWTGDVITLDSGSDSTDYNEAAKRVEGFDFELVDGGWLVWILTGARFLAPGSIMLSGTAGATLPIALCQALTPGEVITGRLYYTSLNDAGSGLDDTDYSGSWDSAGGAGEVDGPNQLKSTPQNTYTGVGGVDDFAGLGISAGHIVTGLYTCLLSESAALLATVQNGGTVRTVIRSANRYGIGVNESAQANYPDWTMRIYRPGTGFIGTLFDVGDAVAAYRFDPGPAKPSIPMSATVAAVPSAVGTDYLVEDLGADHQGPTSGATGWSYAPDDSRDADLPFVVDSLADQNSWVEFSTSVAGSGGGSHPDLVGDDPDAARCDHKHHVVRDRAPTPADDGEQGYPEGTFWIHVDDEDAPTVIFATYLSVDDTAGAAVWLLQADPTAGSSGTTLVIEEVDGSPTGSFDTLKVPNGSLTDNGDGSGTLAYLKPMDGGGDAVFSHGAMGAAETFDPADGNWHYATFDANCTLTLTAPTSGEGCWIVLELLQDGTGGWEVTLPASVVNKADLEAAQDTTADSVSFLSLWTRDGGTTWHGAWAGGSGGGVTLSDATPLVESGAGSAGVGTEASRDDHVHPAAASGGGVGQILISDSHSTPLVFADLLQTEAGDDLLYDAP